MRTTLCLAALACLPLIATAAPITGQFLSPDLGSDILNGRWSEGFAGGGEGQPGNVLHAASWDGAALAGQWEMNDLTLQAVTLMADDVLFGDGVKIYRTTYTGGEMLLKDTGPWWNPADGSGQYTVDFTTYRHLTQVTYSGGQVVDVRSSVYCRGDFADYPGWAVEFMIATAVRQGTGSSLPANYPSFIGDDEGGWGVVQKINMSIAMNIVPEPASLGLLGAGAVLSLLRRRRA